MERAISILILAAMSLAAFALTVQGVNGQEPTALAGVPMTMGLHDIWCKTRLKIGSSLPRWLQYFRLIPGIFLFFGGAGLAAFQLWQVLSRL